MKTKLSATFHGTYEELMHYINDTFKDTSKLVFTVSISTEEVAERAFQELNRISPFTLDYENHSSRFEDAKRLARAGNKIESIKIIREISGIGLAEAKNYVESEIFGDAAGCRRV